MAKKYTLTEEHKAQFPAWRDKWIDNAMSIKPMDDAEKAICREAIKDMYRSANLNPPPDHRIVFVPSPFVLRFASGFASAIWYFRKTAKKESGAATSAATDAATSAAKKKNDSWFNLDISIMVNLSKSFGLGKFGLECAVKCYSSMYQGGNQWSGWSAFLTFFRHVVKLPLDYSKFDAFEKLSEHSGPRIMHEKFCMISDRPTVLLTDDQNRPHCETGPFCKWRDGSSLYAYHGVRIPAWWIENRKDLTPEIALNWKNVEQRRAACELLGWMNVLEHPSLNPKIIDEDQPHIGTLIQVDLPDAPKQWFLKYQCGTGRWFAESVNDKTFNTALKANAGGNGYRGYGNPEDYIPFVRS